MTGLYVEHGQVSDLQTSDLEDGQNDSHFLGPELPRRGFIRAVFFLTSFVIQERIVITKAWSPLTPCTGLALGGRDGLGGGQGSQCLVYFGPSLCAVGQVDFSPSFAHEPGSS